MSGRRAAPIKKAQYYVWYLGWKECRGLGGREFTEPIAKQMIHRRRGEILPKLTIEVSKKELKIVQLVDTKKGKIDKVKYPPVQAPDVTYAVQTLSPDEDVVSCIYLGYNPTTQGAVHVHVYRCDSVETARLFVEHLNAIIALPEHADRARRIEQELVAKGQVVPRPNTIIEDDMEEEEEEVFPAAPPAISPAPMRLEPARSPRIQGKQSPRLSGEPRKPIIASRENDMNLMYGSQGVYRQSSSDDKLINENDYRKLDEETASQYDSLAQELQKKLGKKPLLLPAKDYDTINRQRGNKYDQQLRVCKNDLILAKGGERLESTATDSARGDSENSQDGDLENHSPNDPSPRSLKSSGRFSGGFFENSRDNDVDAELAGITISDPAFFQPERPFSPGPNTQDLRSSYFPGDQTLPGYMPNPSGKPQQQGYSPRTMDREHMRGGAKYSASSLGLAAPPPAHRGGRSHDEGYTSLERGANPVSPRDYHSQFDISRVGAEYPPRPPNIAGRRLRRSEDVPPYEEPPIDYTIAVRKHRQARPSFH